MLISCRETGGMRARNGEIHSIPLNPHPEGGHGAAPLAEVSTGSALFPRTNGGPTGPIPFRGTESWRQSGESQPGDNPVAIGYTWRRRKANPSA